MVLQKYQNFTEMTSNMIYIVAFGGGLKCPRKIHLNTQCPPPKKRGYYSIYLTSKNDAVEPPPRQPYLIVLCLDKSSADSIGDSILSTVRKAAKLAV